MGFEHADLSSTYRYHKRFLQYLSWKHQQQTGHLRYHWILKAPDHSFHVRCLRKVYPFARIVWIHRDQESVIESFFNLIRIMRPAVMTTSEMAHLDSLGQ